MGLSKAGRVVSRWDIYLLTTLVNFMNVKDNTILYEFLKVLFT